MRRAARRAPPGGRAPRDGPHPSRPARCRAGRGRPCAGIRRETSGPGGRAGTASARRASASAPTARGTVCPIAPARDESTPRRSRAAGRAGTGRLGRPCGIELARARRIPPVGGRRGPERVGDAVRRYRLERPGIDQRRQERRLGAQARDVLGVDEAARELVDEQLADQRGAVTEPGQRMIGGRSARRPVDPLRIAHSEDSEHGDCERSSDARSRPAADLPPRAALPSRDAHRRLDDRRQRERVRQQDQRARRRSEWHAKRRRDPVRRREIDRQQQPGRGELGGEPVNVRRQPRQHGQRQPQRSQPAQRDVFSRHGGCDRTARQLQASRCRIHAARKRTPGSISAASRSRRRRSSRVSARFAEETR